jgi:hypothetical protein
MTYKTTRCHNAKDHNLNNHRPCWTPLCCCISLQCPRLLLRCLYIHSFTEQYVISCTVEMLNYILLCRHMDKVENHRSWGKPCWVARYKCSFPSSHCPSYERLLQEISRQADICARRWANNPVMATLQHYTYWPMSRLRSGSQVHTHMVKHIKKLIRKGIILYRAIIWLR